MCKFQKIAFKLKLTYPCVRHVVLLLVDVNPDPSRPVGGDAAALRPTEGDGDHAVDVRQQDGDADANGQGGLLFFGNG